MLAFGNTLGNTSRHTPVPVRAPVPPQPLRPHPLPVALPLAGQPALVGAVDGLRLASHRARRLGDVAELAASREQTNRFLGDLHDGLPPAHRAETTARIGRDDL